MAHRSVLIWLNVAPGSFLRGATMAFAEHLYLVDTDPRQAEAVHYRSYVWNRCDVRVRS